MQLGCTVATHFVEIVVLGKATTLATKIVEKTWKASLLWRQIYEIVINMFLVGKDVMAFFFNLQFSYIGLNIVVIVTGMWSVFGMEFVDSS